MIYLNWIHNSDCQFLQMTPMYITREEWTVIYLKGYALKPLGKFNDAIIISDIDHQTNPMIPLSIRLKLS